MYIKSCCNCRNKLIPDWSTARTHHKSFVEAWKCRGHRSGHATTRAPNHYRQVCGGGDGKSRDNWTTGKWVLSWNIWGHNNRTWKLGCRAGSTRAQGCWRLCWIRRRVKRTRCRGHVCVPSTGISTGRLWRAIEIASGAKELLSGRETGYTGVEPQLECEDAVTWEDIVDKLLFEVNILKECVDSHTLMNWKKRIQEKCAVGLLLQKTPETKKTRYLSNCSTGLCLNPNKELKDSSTVQSYLVPCVCVHLWDWPLI